MAEKVEEDLYEVEKILDYVSFTDAFEKYYKYRKMKYASIFSSDRFKQKKKGKVTVSVSKYYYQVKWLNYDRTELTWEPENTLPTGVNLVEFKKFNNLSQLTTLKLTLTFGKKSKHYTPPVVISEKEEVGYELPFRISTHLFDEINNGKFGIVPVPMFKPKMRQNREYFKKGQEIYAVSRSCIQNDGYMDEQSLVKENQKDDKTFVQGLIRHANIVRICDSFFTRKEDSLEITYLYEWTHQTLRQKVVQEKVVDWKRVARDILNAFCYINRNGIHQSVSLDNIHFHSNGTFKLSHFKNCVCSQQIAAEDVKSESVELAPRKYGVLTAPFDTSIDIYALSIVLLQCTHKSFFRLDPSSVTEIEEDVEKAISELATDEDRRFIRMMLHAREHIHRTRLGSWRFGAQALMQHPVLLPDSGMKSVQCFYFHHLLGFPVNEDVYYQPDDSVNDVIHRHLSRFHENHNEKNNKYMIVVSESFETPLSTTLILNKNERFSKVVREDVEKMNKKLIILPTLSVPVSQKEKPRDVVVIYQQELGGCPIVIEAAQITDVDLTKFLKKHVIRPEYRLFQVQLFSLEKNGKQTKKHQDKFSAKSSQFVLKILEDQSKFDIRNRFSVRKPSEPQWRDVAGIEYQPKKKREILKDLEQNHNNSIGNGKRMRFYSEQDEPINIVE